MKKLLALILAVVMVLSFVACTKEEAKETKTEEKTEVQSKTAEVKDDPAVKGEGVMTHEEFVNAEVDADVVIEGYVQDTQSWWSNKASIYLADKDGAYFVYNASCTEEEFKKLEKGTKIKVTGKRAEWAGEIEVGEGATLEIEEGKFVADIFDATELLANEEELIKHQNEYVSFKGLTVVAKTDKAGNECAFFYNYDNSGEEGSDADLYFDASLGDKTYTFNVEYYLRNENTDTYKAVQSLKVGDKIDLEGFLYWYNGQSTQVTSVTLAK